MTRRTTRQLQRQLARAARRGRPILATLAAAGLAGSAAVAQGDTSQTLTGLPGSAPPNGNQLVPQTEGDNAEVNLSWNDAWQQYGIVEFAGGWDNRGNVYQMEGDTQTITFVPAAANIKVTISSFELDEWAGGGNTSSTWSITGSTIGVLAGNWADKNNANDPSDEGGRTLISPNATGAAGETLTLSFTNLPDTMGGGFDSYLAMDNLTFSSTIIPEPVTAVMAWLGVGGLGAHAMRRRRK